MRKSTHFAVDNPSIKSSSNLSKTRARLFLLLFTGCLRLEPAGKSRPPPYMGWCPASQANRGKLGPNVKAKQKDGAGRFNESWNVSSITLSLCAAGPK